jgi:tRNA(fMet)-specific endonuclease VapC
VLLGDSGAVSAVEAFAQRCLPVPVLGELRYGAINSARSQKNLHAVESLAKRCRVLSVDERTAEVYAEVRFALKQRGRPIPENDVWIASLCLQHDLSLATADGHFEFVQGLRIVKA